MPTPSPWISFTEACENASVWEWMSFLLGDGARGRDWSLGLLGDFAIEPGVPGSVGMAGEECKSSNRYVHNEGLCNAGLVKVCFLSLYACLFSCAIFLNLRAYLILIYNIKIENNFLCYCTRYFTVPFFSHHQSPCSTGIYPWRGNPFFFLSCHC